MSSRHPWPPRALVPLAGAVLALLLLSLLATLSAGTARAEVEKVAGYAGPAYGPGLRHAPTGVKPQSKLWWHDGSWWALMYGTDSVVRVYELRADHTWRPTPTVLAGSTQRSIGDVLSVGNALHVLMRTSGGLQLTNLTYDRAKRTYGRDTGFPAVISRGGTDAATLAQDSRGRLWVSFIANGAVTVTRSLDSGHLWAEPFVPAQAGTGLAQGEITETVSLGDAIGVLWSDQGSGAFRFMRHADDAVDSRWTVETALKGPGLADNQINAQVVRGPQGATLLAAVKTSQGDHGEAGTSPLNLVLARSPKGQWTTHVVGTVADQQTKPLLAVDTNNQVYVFAREARSIVYKSAPLQTLEFPPGSGTRVLDGQDSSFTDPTGTTQILDATSGIVALVSDVTGKRYWHLEMAIDAPVAATSKERSDTQAPATPANLRGYVAAGSVRLTWAPSDDGRHWAPASDLAPVLGYRVFRDGVRIGSPRVTVYSDSPPSGRSHAYTVEAVDLSGNSSAPSPVLQVSVRRPSSGAGVDVPSQLGAIGAGVAGLGLVVLLLVAGVRRAREA